MLAWLVYISKTLLPLNKICLFEELRLVAQYKTASEITIQRHLLKKVHSDFQVFSHYTL